MTRAVCGNCFHWTRGQSSDMTSPLINNPREQWPRGICQLYPPERDGDQWLQPVTDQTRTCGEWAGYETDDGPGGGERAPNVHPFPAPERTAA